MKSFILVLFSIVVLSNGSTPTGPYELPNQYIKLFYATIIIKTSSGHPCTRAITHIDDHTFRANTEGIIQASYYPAGVSDSTANRFITVYKYDTHDSPSRTSLITFAAEEYKTLEPFLIVFPDSP